MIVGCSSGYNIRQYVQHSSLNTQVAEQRNAVLRRLKSMLLYMSKKNFIAHLNLYIWFRNMISTNTELSNEEGSSAKYFTSLRALFKR